MSAANLSRRAVLLGVGNLLLDDEGVGVRAVERFTAGHALPDGVAAIDGGTSAMELLDELEDLDLLVVVDCVRVGRPPASVVVLAGDEVPVFFRQRLSPHQVGLSDVFATLELTGRAPRAIVVIGVQPVSVELDMRLSAPVEAAMPAVLAAIRATFAAEGYTITARAGAEIAGTAPQRRGLADGAGSGGCDGADCASCDVRAPVRVDGVP